MNANDLKAGIIVRGPVLPEPIEVLVVTPLGDVIKIVGAGQKTGQSVWRRVQEGDHDHLRVLVEAYLAVVERVLPEQFLERITAQRVFAKQPGAWG